MGKWWMEPWKMVILSHTHGKFTGSSYNFAVAFLGGGATSCTRSSKCLGRQLATDRRR